MDSFAEAIEGAAGEEDGGAELFLQSAFAAHFDGVLDLGVPDGEGHVDLVDLQQFLLLVGLQLLLSVGQRHRNVFDLSVYLVPLLLKVAFPFGVLLDLLIVLTNLPHPLEVLVVVLNHRDIRFLIFVLELVVTVL